MSKILTYSCYIYILFSIIFGTNLHGQSTLGKDFWLTFGENYHDTSQLHIRIVTTNATTVKMNFGKFGNTVTIPLAAETVYTRNLSKSECDSVKVSHTDPAISTKSIHIQADENIAVYALNILVRTTDATNVLPVNALDRSYYHVSYKSLVGLDGFLIVATEDNTLIYNSGVFAAKINKGEVFAQYTGADLTGTHITADKPVAYFVANPCVNIPVGVVTCDCLYEQLFPVSSWGTAFMVPVTIRGIEIIRVIASQNGTVVTHTGGRVIAGSLNLNAGEFVELEITRAQSGCYIESNNPVGVTSYLTGREYPGLAKTVGDPSIAWVAPVEQAVRTITIAPFISEVSIIEEHHALIVTPTVAKDLTKIKKGAGSWTDLSGGVWLDHTSGYSFYSLPLTDENASYTFTNPANLTILGYGLGFAESYYYLAGSATRKFDGSFYVNNVYYADFEGLRFCSETVEITTGIKAPMHSDEGHLRWFIDNVEDVGLRDLQEWSKQLSEGTYSLSMTVKYSDETVDTLTTLIVIDRKYEPVLTDTAVCQTGDTELKVKNPDDRFSYFWYDKTETRLVSNRSSLTVSNPDRDTVFHVKAMSSSCVSSANIKVSVYPDAEPDAEQRICYSKSALLEFPVGYSAVNWFANAAHTDTIGKSAAITVTDIVRDTVFYAVAKSTEGCPVRHRANIYVELPPQLTVTALDTICAGTRILLTMTDDENVISTWYADNYATSITAENSYLTDPIIIDTVFYAEAVGSNGCVSRKSGAIKVAYPPRVTAMDDAFLCHGDELELRTVDAVGTVKWNVENLTVSPETATQYFVTASRNHCPEAVDSVKVTVGKRLYLLPENLSKIESVGTYSQEFSSNAVFPIYTLEQGDLPPGLTLSPTGVLSGEIHASSDESSFVFTVKVEDSARCSVLQEYVIQTDFLASKIPKVFTPNGDGINDIFMQGIYGYDIFIFDRLGAAIYKGTDGWDGTYKGSPVPCDIYFYVLKYNANGKEKTISGYVGVER